MEEESLTPQVLSSAISSICAVISNYWSLIEVHVERPPALSLSLHRWIPATHLLHKVTLPEIQRVISIILFSLTRSSPQTPSLSSRKQLAPFDVWLDSRWVTFTAVYSASSQDAVITFYMAPCSKISTLAFRRCSLALSECEVPFLMVGVCWSLSCHHII